MTGFSNPRLGILTLALVVMLAALPTLAQEQRGTREEALALLDKATVLVGQAGPDVVREKLTDPAGGFIDRDLYATVLDRDGVMLVHPKTPVLIGKNLMALADVDGKLFIKEAVETAIEKGQGVVTYKWRDPLTRQISTKDMHFKRVGDYIVSVGVYQ